MTTPDPGRRPTPPEHEDDTPAAAIAELDKLTATFTQAANKEDAARALLQVTYLRHRFARSAPPGKLAEHVPYDRNHAQVLAKKAGVPPLRGPKAKRPPEYDPAVSAVAYAELDGVTAALQEAESRFAEARKTLQAAIVRHYADRTLPPGVIVEHTPYDRVHVGRIVKAAGVPLIRG